MRQIIETLQAELRTLEHEYRVELPKEIHTAVAMGDLRENAEYKAALERQAYVRARIGQLRERLSSLGSMNLDRIPRDKAGLGSSVKVLDLDSDEERVFELVVPELSDLDRGLISIASPIGRGLMGVEEGDEIAVSTPSGTRRFEVLELLTIHDKGTQEP
jgi:transcription elongation factor GreA